MVDFGTKLKDIRREKKITQRDLAERVGVDFTYISKMENGRLENFPSLETIQKIADVLEVNSEELILLAEKIPDEFRKTIAVDKLAIAFLRKASILTEDQRRKISDVINGEKE